jgi:hypothetical protein
MTSATTQAFAPFFCTAFVRSIITPLAGWSLRWYGCFQQIHLPLHDRRIGSHLQKLENRIGSKLHGATVLAKPAPAAMTP